MVRMEKNQIVALTLIAVAVNEPVYCQNRSWLGGMMPWARSSLLLRSRIRNSLLLVASPAGRGGTVGKWARACSTNGISNQIHRFAAVTADCSGSFRDCGFQPIQGDDHGSFRSKMAIKRPIYGYHWRTLPVPPVPLLMPYRICPPSATPNP